MVTLSTLRTWDTTHLEEAAAHWDSVADQWESSFDAVHQESLSPGGTPWDGLGADAIQLRTATDRSRVRGVTDTLRTNAAAARDGADELHAAKNNALNAVAAAHEQGFIVAEDFSVSDPHTYPPAIAAGRGVQAEAHSSVIAGRVSYLSQTDARVAGQLSQSIWGADFPLDVPKPLDPPPSQPSQPSSADPLTDLMLPPSATAPPPPPLAAEQFYDQIVAELAKRPPPDPLVMEALRQAYAANHQACNSWQWAGGWLGLGGSTAGLFASIPGLIPPITPVGVLGATASLAGIGGSGAALIDCATR